MTPLIFVSVHRQEGSDFCVLCLVRVYAVTSIENQTLLLKNSDPLTKATASDQNTTIATSGAAPNAPNPSQIVPTTASVCCGRKGYDVSQQLPADRQYRCLSDGRMMA